MVKLLLVLFLATFGMCSAGTITVTGSGTFSTTDTADTLVTPGDVFALAFLVQSNPIIAPGNFTSVSFDVPVAGFMYDLNGVPVSVGQPTEITFYTAADGGGFEVDFGPSTEFLFGSSQIFSGTTAAPTFSLGSFANQSFLFLDSANVDSNSATVTLTPEPSSILLVLCGAIVLFAISVRRSARVAGSLNV